MRSRDRKNLAILLTVTILLSMSLVFLNRGKMRASRPHQALNLQLCDPNQVRAFEITRHAGAMPSETLRFERRDTPLKDAPEAVLQSQADWVITSPPLGEADNVFAQRLSGYCQFTTAWELNHPVGPSEAGAGPELKLWVGASNQVVWLRFGTALPQRYVELRLATAGENSLVYAVPATFAEWLSVPATRLQNHRVMRTGLDMIDGVTVDYGQGRKLRLEREGADWQVTAVAGKARKITNPENFINRLANLQATHVSPPSSGTDARSGGTDAPHALDAVPRASRAAPSLPTCSPRKGDIAVTIDAIRGPTETIRFMRRRQDKLNKSNAIEACSTLRQATFGVHVDLWRYLN